MYTAVTVFITHNSMRTFPHFNSGSVFVKKKYTKIWYAHTGHLHACEPEYQFLAVLKAEHISYKLNQFSYWLQCIKNIYFLLEHWAENFGSLWGECNFCLFTILILLPITDSGISVWQPRHRIIFFFFYFHLKLICEWEQN